MACDMQRVGDGTSGEGERRKKYSQLHDKVEV